MTEEDGGVVVFIQLSSVDNQRQWRLTDKIILSHKERVLRCGSNKK